MKIYGHNITCTEAGPHEEKRPKPQHMIPAIRIYQIH